MQVEIDYAKMLDGLGYEPCGVRLGRQGEEMMTRHGVRVIGSGGTADPVLIVRPKRKRQWLVEEMPLHAGGVDFTALESERVHIRIVRELTPGPVRESNPRCACGHRQDIHSMWGLIPSIRCRDCNCVCFTEPV